MPRDRFESPFQWNERRTSGVADRIVTRASPKIVSGAVLTIAPIQTGGYSNALSAIYREMATVPYGSAPRTGGSRTAPTKLLDPVGLLIHERSLL